MASRDTSASAHRVRAFADSLAPSMLGLLGSISMFVGSLGVGWLGLDSAVRTWPVIAMLRGSTLGREFCAAALLVGGVLMLLAWLRMRALAASDHPRALSTILLAAGAWAAPLLFAVPIFSRDLFAYVAQGRLMVSHIDPYTSGIATLPGWFSLGVDPLWADTSTPYGPLYLLIEGTAVRLAGWNDPEVSIALLRMVSVVGVVASAYYLLRIARLRGLSLPMTAWIVVANPLTLLLFVAAGHNDAVMLAGILSALFYAMTGRRALAIVLLAAAIAVKPIAILALPVLALFWLRSDAPLRERMRLWLVTGLAAVGLVGALGVVLGIGMGWVVAMIVPGSIEHWYAPLAAITTVIGGAFEFVGQDPTVAVSIVKAVALLAAAAVVLALMTSRRAIDPIARLTGSLLAVITASTAIHPWYAMWVFPLAALATRWRPEQRHLAVYATIFFTFVTLGEPVDGGGGGLDGLPARVVTVLAVAIVGVLVVLDYTRRERVRPRALLGALPFRAAAGEILAARPSRAPLRVGD